MEPLAGLRAEPLARAAMHDNAAALATRTRGPRLPAPRNRLNERVLALLGIRTPAAAKPGCCRGACC